MTMSDLVTRIPQRATQLLIPFGVLLGGLFGAGIGFHLWLTVGGLAAVAILALAVISPTARLIVVVLGALLVFQSSTEVGLAKIAFAALVLMCTVISAIHLARCQDEIVRKCRSFLFGTCVFGLFLPVTLIVSRSNAISPSDWFRDVLPYVLLVALPIIGLDAGLTMSSGKVQAVIGVTGVIAAIGTALYWLARRGVSSWGVERVILSTAALVALGFALALVRSGIGHRRRLWLLASAIILILMLLPGTRTNTVLLVGALGVIGSPAKSRVPVRRIALAATAMVLAAVTLLPTFVGAVSSDPNFFRNRLASAETVIRGEAVKDQSFVLRQRSYHWASQKIEANRWLGTGPGYRYSNGQYSLDTPLVVVAKFGIVGLAALIGYFASIYLSVRALRRWQGYGIAQTMARGWVWVLIALLPFGPWTEDKGFSLALALLVAAIVSEAKKSRSVECQTHSAQSTNLAYAKRAQSSIRLSGYRYSLPAERGRHLDGAGASRRTSRALS
jgi:hypothetical protein